MLVQSVGASSFTGWPALPYFFDWQLRGQSNVIAISVEKHEFVTFAWSQASEIEKSFQDLDETQNELHNVAYFEEFLTRLRHSCGGVKHALQHLLRNSQECSQ